MTQTTKSYIRMALFVAILVVSAYISFPIPFSPVMVTALTLVMCLIAFLFTPRETLIIIGVYILMGAIGLPVFTGAAGGLDKLFGYTGGFIWSWLICYPLLSYFKGNSFSTISYSWRAILITLPITYVMGVIGGMLVLHIPLDKAIFGFVIPFIPGDIVKAIMAAIIAVRIQRFNA